jgi:hypothetical protein
MSAPNEPFFTGSGWIAGPALLVEWLRTGRYPVSTETKLQLAIRDRLIELKVTAWREYRLAPGERVDFFVEGGVAIEAKTRCSKRKIFRQLERYALRPEVTALILVTGTAMGLPALIAGKPAFYVSLGRASL